MIDSTAQIDGAVAARAAYVHIPFCRRRCPYCDFAVVDLSAGSPSVQRYVDAVATEIDMEPEWGPLHAVNFGGGTPSALTPRQLEILILALSNRFGLADGAEVSIEANPEDWTPEYAASLRKLGINRVSLGVQSFDDDMLGFLGRSHTPEQGMQAVRVAQASGFEAVSLDLIFGTPGETLESWQRTVDVACELGPQHLSAYALTVERGTELSRSVASGAPGPDDDDQADKYEWLASVAADRYDHYEVSNWATAAAYCRYNLTTWAQGEYAAFGLGAHGHRDGERRRNVRRLDAYLDQVEKGERPEAGSEKLDDWAREKERVFLGVRRRAGVVAGEAGGAFLDCEAGKRFVAAGVVSLRDDRLVVVNPLLTDAVAREILALDPPLQ